MRRGELRDYFVGAGVKRLSAVDAEPQSSSQHEVGTTRDMRHQFLGETQHQRFRAVYIWLGEHEEALSSEGTATHYDAREQQVHRAPEWRLYYPSNPVTEAMRQGDTLFLAMTNDQILYFIVAPEGSTSERQLSWLFDLQPSGQTFVSREVLDHHRDLDFAARFILNEIGFEFQQPDSGQLNFIIEQFDLKFPKTVEFSQLARATLPGVKAEDDPDAALMAWLSHEEALFKCLERRIVAARLQEGFRESGGEIDVESFLRFSLSVHNRRKARMGQSLEHHLEAVFRAHDISYVRGAVTEYKQRPDFLFPSEEAYRAAPNSGDARLSMLGAKSSCNERWRQVLAEAAKIPKKHLLTLEPGISKPQTHQMETSGLQLVVPLPIQDTYTEDQRTWLWSVADFIRDVRTRLKRSESS